MTRSKLKLSFFIKLINQYLIWREFSLNYNQFTNQQNIRMQIQDSQSSSVQSESAIKRLKHKQYNCLIDQIYIGSLAAFCLCGSKFRIKYTNQKLKVVRSAHPLKGDPIYLTVQTKESACGKPIKIDQQKCKENYLKSKVFRNSLRNIDFDHFSQYIRFYPMFVSMWYRIMKSSDVRIQFCVNVTQDYVLGSLIVPIRIDIFMKRSIINENTNFSGLRYNELINSLQQTRKRVKELEETKKELKITKAKSCQKQAKQLNNEISLLKIQVSKLQQVLRNQKLVRLFLVYLMEKINVKVLKRCLIKPKPKNNFFICQFKKEMIGLKVSEKNQKSKDKRTFGVQKLLRCQQLYMLIADPNDLKRYQQWLSPEKQHFFRNWMKQDESEAIKLKKAEQAQIQRIQMLQKRSQTIAQNIQQHSIGSNYQSCSFQLNVQQKTYQQRQIQNVQQLFGSLANNQSACQFYISKQNKEIIDRFEQQNKHFICHQQPKNMSSQLKYYQGQALTWMKYRQQKIQADQLFDNEYLQKFQFYEYQRSLNPFWSELQFISKQTFYINHLTGQITKKFTPWQKVKGGILGDQMGLGKTVMAIALIADQNFKGTNMIVVPLNVLSQWSDQFGKHCTKNPNIYMFHGNGARRDVNLLEYDIVLTTYNTLAIQYKAYKESKQELQESREIYLFDYNFRRVILDEAQNIKQSATVQFSAARQLKAEFRWCLTGTLVQNSEQDLFSILKFLNVQAFSQSSWWNNYIKNAETMAQKFNCIHTILRPILLRRTKQTTNIHGGQIISLPQRNYFVMRPEFRQAERQIYGQLEQGVRNYFLNLSTNEKNSYTHIFQIISRLRQFCCHPSLVFKKDLSEVRKGDVIKVLNEFLREGTPSSFKQKVVANLIDDNSHVCSVCLQPPYQEAVWTKCGHVYCQQCLKKWLIHQSFCTICRKQIRNIKYFRRKDIPDEQKQEKYTNLIQSDSSKLEAIVKVMLQCKQRKQKCVIFTQWLRVIQLIAKKLKEMNLEFCQITGGMNRQKRSQSVTQFKQYKSKSFILISLRAGGTGLNLSMANNVIICDPWWNPAQEDQAINRIHRIGQQKDVNIYRFIMKDSIEEKVEKMHEFKRKLADHVLMKVGENKAQQNETTQMLRMFIQ